MEATKGLAQPSFRQDMLAAYAKVMTDSVSKLMYEWEKDADGRGVIEVAPAMSRLALHIAGRTLFGQDVSRTADAIGSAFAVVRTLLDFRVKHRLTSLPISWPTRRNREFRYAMKELTDIVLSLIRRHPCEAPHQEYLLSMLIPARDETPVSKCPIGKSAPRRLHS